MIKLGVKLDFKKWLNNSTTTNEKNIFFRYQDNCKLYNIPIDIYEASLYLVNRSNYHQLKHDKAIMADSVVKKSSDILGYSFSSHY